MQLSNYCDNVVETTEKLKCHFDVIMYETDGNAGRGISRLKSVSHIF